MSAPHGVQVTTCRSCRAPIWFGLVWGSPCPMDEADDKTFPFAATGRRGLPVVHRTLQGRRYVELDNRTEGTRRWRIHRCDVSRRERLARQGRMNPPTTRRP